MTFDPTATPDLGAYQREIRMSPPELVAALAQQLGWSLVAYLGRANQTRTAKQWGQGTREIADTADLERFRSAFRAASLITSSQSAEMAQAWFQGMDPALGDVSPARMLREGDVTVVGPRIVAAARRFAGCG